VNAAVMAMVGILHRLDGAKDLLWVMKLPLSNSARVFGSYPYRANAAQFLNLIWPVALGLWWGLRVERLRRDPLGSRSGGQPYPLLLLLVAIMVGAVLVAASRGGIAVSLLQMGVALVILARSMSGWRPRVGMALAFVTALALGWGLAGKSLEQRFSNSLVDNSLSGRTEIYQVARRMVPDFPVWGSGAETFLSLNGLYRSGLSGIWHGYVHDDWLETRLTFGWVGFSCTLGLLAMAVVVRWRCGALPMPREFEWLTWVGLVGLMMHARVDFPFQIPSLHLLFLILAALFTVAGPPIAKTTQAASNRS
jgi:O-antigen ligase